MLDLRDLRAEPDTVREALRRRGIGEGKDPVTEVLSLDERRREAITRGDALRARRNEVSRAIGDLKRAGEDASGPISDMQEVARELA